MKSVIRGWLSRSAPLGALLLAACATQTIPPPQFNLGRDSEGDRCSAVRTNRDPAAMGYFDSSYSINCRKVTASRSLGFIRSVPEDAPAVASIEASLSCGAASAVTVSGIGPAQARRCYDQSIGTEAVVISFQRGDRRIIGSASRATLGPLEEGLRMMVGAMAPVGEDGEQQATSVDVSALAAAPERPADPQNSEYFDTEVALRRGIDLNLKGLYSEASRILNDSLSRIPDSAPARMRAEFFLEAGLADSNINFSEAAAEHFASANAIIASDPSAADPVLLRKREIYRALDLINQRRNGAALSALDQLVTQRGEGMMPLQDPTLLRRVNQPARSGDVGSVLAIPDKNLINQLALDAEANRARSAALLALGDEPGAVKALAAADDAYATLSRERLDEAPLMWIGARLERQRGRLAARRQDWNTAVLSFDKSLDGLRQSSIASGGTGNEPRIAEVQLERASIIAQRGDPPEVVRREYDQAIETLVSSELAGGAIPVGYERYLDLLVSEAKDGAPDELYESFFRALQAVGEPALARQVSSIQNVVTADPKLGVLLRDRTDLEREITALRYQISAAPPEQMEALEARRRTAESRLLTLQDQLAGDRRFSTIDTRPATIAEIRAALLAGEVFLKVSTLGQKAYGVVISADRTFIYALQLQTPMLQELADEVRKSIDGGLDIDGTLSPYDVPGAYALFALITGPAAETVANARAIVVDPSGPLERLPLGVLVADRASVDRFRTKKGLEKFNVSDVSFVAKNSAISTAVSPRSFLVARSLPPSQAPRPFIGFAEHQPPETGPQFASAGRIEVGDVCSAEASALREFASRWAPIAQEEIVIASQALGTPDAPLVTGAQFTDTAVKARGDLDQFQVLHFATHGLQEGQWGCDKSPPALVTTFGDANSDGLLSFAEVAALRLDANLVVLAACDTGSGVRSQALARQSGQEEAGATLEGLVRAFLTANSRAVLATHWRVPATEGTPELMRAFYEAARTEPIGGALQAAQRALIQNPDYSHPFFWGAYFVVGDSGKMMISSAARSQTATNTAAKSPSAN